MCELESEAGTIDSIRKKNYNLQYAHYFVQKRKKPKKKEDGEEKSKIKSKKKWGSDQQNKIMISKTIANNVEILKTNKKGKGGDIGKGINPLKPEDITDEYIDKLIN
jgi:hypothetical protein